jgi:hypothetical protein
VNSRRIKAKRRWEQFLQDYEEWRVAMGFEPTAEQDNLQANMYDDARIACGEMFDAAHLLP